MIFVIKKMTKAFTQFLNFFFVKIIANSDVQI